MKKILLDTDIGGDIDDALCLAYLLRQPLCEIVGITTVGGEVEKRAMIADAICKAAGENISIYAGAEQTMLPNSLYPIPDGAAKLTYWAHETSFKKNQAVDFMRKTIRANPHEISLLAIGHLTNIALLFLVDPEIPSLLKELYIMSGVFSDELEASMDMPMANWNSWIDPHACAVVYNTNVPIHKTFGLNITSELVLTRDDKFNLFNTNLMKAVEDFGSPWLENNKMTFHDPLVAACLFEPQLCKYQRGFIQVESYNQQKLGMMSFLEDARGNCEIATSVDRYGFFEHYVSISCK
ncbi:nucleoside hydrolase [Metabacillus sp. Hm71]|uniref:nucleoside hydrolase n=1 Tax=Metabacillus sp. Hm71 TaxID=3450743 RepID=UPI003F41F5C1